MMDPKLKIEILDKIITLVMASLGLVAALAWNEAIQQIFKDIFGQASSTWAMVLYALIITVIVVLLTLKLTRMLDVAKQKLSSNDKKNNN